MKKEPKIDNLQFISVGDKKQFAVLPYDEFLLMKKALDDGEAKLAAISEKSKDISGAFKTLQQAFESMSAALPIKSTSAAA